MAAPVDNTATLKSLVSVANSKIEPKILTDRNFKVLSIKPLRSTTSPHNTVASVQVDLAGDSPIAIVSSDRYSRRLVEFTRIDLKDIANFRAIPKNEKGQYIGEITDAASVITLLNAAIEEDELVLITTADATVVKAAEDSLGYIGAITFAGAVGTMVPPSGIAVTVDNLLSVGQTVTATVAITPTDATDKTVTVTAVPEDILEITNGGKTIKALKDGAVSVTYTSNANPAVTVTKSIEVTDPSQDATYSAKLTFEDSYGPEMGRDLANHINVGDIVNVIIQTTDLAVNKDVTLEVVGTGFEYDLDSAAQTLTTAANELVVPLAITAVTGETPTINVLVHDALSGDVITGTNSATLHNPAIVPTTVTIDNTPPNIPAGQEFGVMATLDVTDYTTRNVVWTSNHPDTVTITVNEHTALSAMVSLDPGLAADTKVVLTCTVDGVAGSSAEINIAAV